MTPEEAAKALHEFEERIRIEREGRDLPPEPGDGDDACEICGSTNGFEMVYDAESPLVKCKGCGEIVAR